VGHTRWHPEIPPIVRIEPGELVVMDARDGGDAQIGPDTTAEDQSDYDLDRLHPLTGPFHIEGVEAGDIVEVEILEIEHPGFAWSRVSPGGGGLMSQWVRDSLLVKWRLKGNVARSPDLPGVTIPGAPFVGTIGLAPSSGRLAAILERERKLSEAGGWALLPSPKHAVPNITTVCEAGLRTLPPREFGGNMDIKDAAAGSRVSFVANVPGGLLSIGDLHFAQGDGESFGTAIEMSGVVTFRCRVRPLADVKWRPRGPVIETPERSADRRTRRCLITTGVPVDDDGNNSFMDLNLAAQNALNEMATYLTEERDYTRAQAHCIVSVAADVRINVVNNPPNPVVSVALPLDIFETAEA
jgi:formamidase